MNNPAIIWAIVGLALIAVEVFTATFFLVFFGVSAFIVAGLSLVGLVHPAWQIILFALIAIAGVVLLRKRLVSSLTAKKGLPGDEMQSIVLTDDVPAGGSAYIMYQGTTWTAVNGTGADFKKGENALIARMDGVKIILTRG